MDFRILGPVEVLSGGRRVQLPGQRQRALLSYLLLHANEVVAAERLLDQLWEEAPRGGLAALQTQVSRLRKLVGDRIVTDGSGYSLRVEPGELDLDRFRALLAKAGGATPERRSALLREAAELFRGDPLTGVDAPFAELAAAGLEELRLGTLEERLDADLACGLHGDLVAELGPLVAQHPLRERLRGQLILALYRCGRQADALEEYRRTRQMLADELGLEPSPALRELERAILRHDPELASPARLRPPQAVPAARRRRVAYAGLLAVALGGGLAAAFAVVGGGGSHRQPRTAALVTRPAARPHRARVVPQIVHRVVRPRTVRVTTPARQSTVFVRVVTETTHAAVVTHAATTTATTARRTRPKTTGVVTVTTPLQVIRLGGPDPIHWNADSVGTGPTETESDGGVELTIPADAVPGGQYTSISAQVSTRCRFDGDFDARVDYQLLDWPAANGVAAGLNSWIFPNLNSSANRASSVYSEAYNGDVGQHFSSVNTADTHGSLRLARRNGVETAYYLSGGKWIALESRPAPGGATIALQLYANGSDFAHQQVRVTFDNFSLVAKGEGDCQY